MKLTTFSKKIRAFRLKAKFTREQLANLLAISLSEYSEIEESRKEPNEQFLQDMCDFYGFEMAELKKDLKDGSKGKLTLLNNGDDQ